MKHPSRVTVTRTATGYRYKHHAHTSHDEYPDRLTAARAAVAYAHSMDWVYVEIQQGHFEMQEGHRAVQEGVEELSTLFAWGSLHSAAFHATEQANEEQPHGSS